MNAQHIPVWVSLAWDFLAIMASSVSSEHAFSAAGITISKHRNRLKGDIVEALQFLKCLQHKNSLFQESFTTADELDMEKEECNGRLVAEEDRSLLVTDELGWIVLDDGNEEWEDVTVL